MKRFTYLLGLSMLSAALVTMSSCKKEEALTIADEQAHFTNLTSDTYFVTGPSVVYKVPVGLTNVSSQDRTINVNITSPTGAVQGTHYNVSTKSIVIPAGKAVDSITVTGVFAQYQAGRKDTLVFQITEGGVKPSDYNSTFRLAMRGPCFEGDIVPAEFLGNYTRSNEDGPAGPYGPYTTAITTVTPTSATTATITVANIYDSGWNPITFLMDWTNINARTVTVVAQTAGIGDAGTLSSAYAGQQVAVRPIAGANGFSYCNQTLNLRMQLGVTGLGYFTAPYTLSMAR